jgi:DNA repair photolyase
LTVKPVFLDWLEQAVPSQKERIESRIRETRGGQLYDASFGTRMRGQGQIADQIRQTFEVFARKYGLLENNQTLDFSKFRRPVPRSGQLWLFNDPVPS